LRKVQEMKLNRGGCIQFIDIYLPVISKSRCASIILAYRSNSFWKI